MDIIETVLEELGLNQNERTIYKTLLRLGVSPASVLGDRSNISRSTAQYTCNQLAKKGIVTKSKKANTFLYVIESPNDLLGLVHKKQEKLQEQERRTQHVVQSLQALQSTQVVLPKVRFFEGKEGVAHAYDEIIKDMKPTETIYILSSTLDDSDKYDLEELKMNFTKKRCKKSVSAKTINAYSKRGVRVQQEQDRWNRKTLLVPAEQFPISNTEIYIYNNKVYSMSFEDEGLFAYIVENQGIAKMLHAYFDITWMAAEQLDKTLKK